MDQKKVVTMQEDGREIKIEMDVVENRVTITEDLDGDKETVTMTSSESFSLALQLMEMKQLSDFAAIDHLKKDQLKDGSA